MDKTHHIKLMQLYKNWAGEEPISISPLPPSASYREYFRMKSENKIALGVFNPDQKENKAFVTFTKHFIKHNLNVPKLYAENLDSNIYLIEDLGSTTLYSHITESRKNGSTENNFLKFYEHALTELLKFQTIASKDFDYSACYPRSSFDKQSLQWDLNYFKYYFVKLTKTPFDEQKLEDDFGKLIEFLLSAGSNYFMYRDFQSRNIMIKNEELFFIDYQGGRKGAPQYDVASILYDAKADLSQEFRNKLLDFYVSLLSQSKKIDSTLFKKYFYGFVLIRILQSMGTYGFRGIYEKKAHFLKSIPYAIRNLKHLIENDLLPDGLNELKTVLNNIVENNSLNNISEIEGTDKLIVSINSFSYMNSLPTDLTGNGGGFVFDCRSLNNPGRYDEYKMLTGKDQPVIDFLSKENDVKVFLRNVYSIVDQTIKNYNERGFKNLMINFGCTGGQHRSVYCAERLAEHLRNQDSIIVNLKHAELEKKGLLK